MNTEKESQLPHRLPRFVVLEKRRGVTPLEAVQEWKTMHKAEFQGLETTADFPVAYAGRLDPMAEGKLLVLLGDECKKMGKYTGLDKEYLVEVLLDFSTDTGDVLGLPNATRRSEVPNKSEIAKAIKKETGTQMRKYPIFSSKTVSGKPLFLYALEGAVDSIQIPEHEETFYDIQLRGIEKISKGELQERVVDALREVPRSDEPSKKLGADFRQDEIREQWQKIFAEMGEREFVILKLRVTCGSGAYMRTLAQRIGESVGTSALAFSIKRTKIGKVLRVAGITAWTKQF